MRRIPCLALAISILLAGTVTAQTVPELEYRVLLDELGDERLRVTVALSGFPGDEIILRSVPSYMDNPVAAPRGRTVHALRVRDARGLELPLNGGEDPAGRRFWRIRPPAEGPVFVDYELNIDFEESEQTRNYPTQIPFMDSERAWLAGNYVFCYPELASETPATLRSPVHIGLDFDLPETVPLHGLPDGRIELGNLYELLSLQFGLGSYTTESLTTVGPAVEMITKSAGEFDEGEREALRCWTTEIVETLTEFFGGAPFPESNFYYFRNDGIGGLEGAYTCQAYVEHDVDLTDADDDNVRSFLDVALHECFHTWNPIGLFAIEDPWFKEGVTSYYGVVLTLRLGWAELADYEDDWERYGILLTVNDLLDEVALTDPRIWYREYDGEDWRHLTYSRGHAVALLLDVMIRESSDNEHSLDDVMRALFSRFARSHFTHAQLIETIESSTGVDVAPFCAEYVSGTRVASPSEVQAALESASRLGVFGEDAAKKH